MKGRTTLKVIGCEVVLVVDGAAGSPIHMVAKYVNGSVAATMAAIIAKRMGLRRCALGWHRVVK